MRKSTTITDDHLYIQVAEGIEKMISDEVLKIGDKLPSVRVLSDEQGISMGTAFQAYYLLEGRGLIESRPKSGYYVRFNHRRFPQMPSTRGYEPVSSEVSVQEMIASIYKDIAAGNVINFALAVPDISLLPAAKINKSVMYALRNAKDHCIGYEQVQGNPELRKQAARLAFSWGGKVKPDEVVITAGCLEAIQLCLKAVTAPGDTVAVENPTYFGISQSIESLGLKVVEIPADPETGIDRKALEKAIKKFSVKACVLVPNFNNPLGSLVPDAAKKQLVELITRCQVPLIEDDIYGELYFGKNRPRPCKYYDTQGWVLHCTSLSKSLTPGYRIGWCLPGRFLEKVKELKRVHNISCPTLTQAAMAHYLANGRYEYHLKALRKALHTQCLRYVQAIIEHFPADTKVSRPQGGYVLWVELNKKVDTSRLRIEAMKHNISIVPGRIFSAGNNYTNFLRISFSRPWNENDEYGLRVLGKLISGMIRK